jgi:hypothetical protein
LQFRNPLFQKETRMIIALVAATSVLVALLTLGYAREFRLRRALQSLLTRSLTQRRDKGRTDPMKKMKRRFGVMLATMLLPATVVGCSTPDSRLSQLAQQAMNEQSQQNQSMADPSYKLAEAAKELVARDAQARQELAEFQQELTMQVNQQQAAIDASRNRLEQERQEIALQRHRDPIIAAAIQDLGVVLACLLPLLIAGLVVRQMRHQEPDHAAVAELLVSELTSDRPRLLPASCVPRLTTASEKESSRRAPLLADAHDPSTPPF